MKMRRLFMAAASIVTSLLLLLPATPAMAASITVSPDNGPVDTLMHVSGNGFTPSESYSILFPYNAPFEDETNGTVAIDGTISRSIDVPEMPGGAYTVRVETDFETASDTFNVEPQVAQSVIILSTLQRSKTAILCRACFSTRSIRP